MQAASPTRRLALSMLLAGASAWPAAWAANAGSLLRIDVNYHVDFYPEERAGLEAWVERLKPKMMTWWPILTAALASPGFTPTDQISLEFYRIEPSTVPAATIKTRIVVDPAYVLAHLHNPDMFGMVGHEMVHVMQAYPGHLAPWLTEGLADYMRYYVLIPDDPGRAFDPKDAHFDGGYQPTAGLLDWVERGHPGAVRRVNAVMRQGGDGPAELSRQAGAPLEMVWAAYLASRPAATSPEAVRARQVGQGRL